jgi:CRISPR-associated protein Csy1
MTRAALAAIEARLAAGDAAGARAAAATLLAGASLGVGERVAALKLRARAHELLADPRGAIVDLEGVLALSPADARACNALGLACADAGEAERALDAFRRATALDPGFARGWNNYGSALRSAGRPEAARDAFAHAVAADPAYALAWANLGAVHREIGDDAGAQTALARALALDPAQRVAVYTLAGLRRDQGDVDAAATLYAQSAALEPRNANAALFLGGTLAERDDLAAAANAFDSALARDGRMLRAAIARRLTLPMVPDSAAAIGALRARYAEGLEALAEELPQRTAALTADRAVDELRWTNFLLAYQGEDDRALQRRYAEIAGQVVAQRAPEWLAPPRRAAGKRLRVGFVSAFFRDGTAGRYFERWITDLPRDRFEVFVYHLQPTVDELGGRLSARADAFRPCPRWRPSQLAPRIRGDTLDVLVYPELGMDAATFALAMLRLAPRQCAAWGHPVTTGLPTIDVFFSSAGMEPPGAETHYTETLVRLPGIGTRYATPPAPADADRLRFGLPEGVPLLLCPQSAFKVHPDDDALFARVLAAAPAAHVVLFEARHPALTAKLRRRMAIACAAADVDIEGRAHFLRQCGHDDYLRLNASCDAMLDTSRWSGGNTALDALACGLPLVTLPGRFMRGRQSAEMLRLAGAESLIARDAGDYLRIAVRLASDRGWRDAQAERIRAGRAGVFDDPRPLGALAEALVSIVET